MFTVTGYIDGVAYRCDVDPASSNGDDGIVAECGPSTPLERMRAAAVTGETVSASPTSVETPMSLTDPVCVLAWLTTNTEVVDTTGDVPDVPTDPDMVGPDWVY